MRSGTLLLTACVALVVIAVALTLASVVSDLVGAIAAPLHALARVPGAP